MPIQILPHAGQDRRKISRDRPWEAGISDWNQSTAPLVSRIIRTAIDLGNSIPGQLLGLQRRSRARPAWERRSGTARQKVFFS